jgi:leader peptidase (prepilin peptidase)/N-methyltransferase
MCHWFFIFAVFAFLIGCSVGSFLNVVIYRLPRAGYSIVKPTRSFCPACLVTIRWYDNIPLLSWFFLGGRCRFCGSVISPRYPIVELLTGLLFFASALQFVVRVPQPDYAVWAAISAFSALMMAISFIDIDFRIIPDVLSGPGLLAAIAVSALVPTLHALEMNHAERFLAGYGNLFRFILDLAEPFRASALAVMLSLAGLTVGYCLIFVIRFVSSVIARREAMGMGDAKIMALVGAFTGWRGAILAIFIGALLGALIAPALRIALRSRDPKIAFGPFLAAGGVAVALFRKELVGFVMITYPELVSKNPDLFMFGMFGICILLLAYLVIMRKVGKGGNSDETN